MADQVLKHFIDLIMPLEKYIIKMYQFGSRCRDDWRPDSDYDVLVVLERRDQDVVNSLYDAVMDVLLSTGKLVSLKIFSVKEFERLTAIPTPFMENVMKEGKQIYMGNSESTCNHSDNARSH